MFCDVDSADGRETSESIEVPSVSERLLEECGDSGSNLRQLQPLQTGRGCYGTQQPSRNTIRMKDKVKN